MATSAPPASSNIDIGRALTYIKDDPDWIRKLVIGSLVVIAGMFLVGTPLLIGYIQRTIKQSAEGRTPPLPEWDDWGGLFVEGLKVFAVMFAHAMIVFLPMMCCLGGAMGLMGAGQRAGDGGGPLAAVGVLGMIFVYGLILVVAIGLSVYLPAIQARVALTGNLGDAFQTKANLAFIRRNLVNYALSIGVMLIGNFVAQFAVLALCVGILPATVWSYTAFAYALGETIRRDPQFAATGTI